MINSNSSRSSCLAFDVSKLFHSSSLWSQNPWDDELSLSYREDSDFICILFVLGNENFHVDEIMW